MNREESEKLMKDILDCGKRFEDAVQDLINTQGSQEAIDAVKTIDAEYKILNKKYWDWLGI